MSDQVLVEQFILMGQVDVPATTENTMKLLGRLGSLGFLPNISQEISLADGKMQNRLNLANMVDVNIAFNSDRIILSRSPDASGKFNTRPFVDLVKEVFGLIGGDLPLEIKRVVIAREKFMAEYPEERLEAISRKFINYEDDHGAFEWFVRTSVLEDVQGVKQLKVVECGRTQGVMQVGLSQTHFDRVRIKVEVGTNMSDHSLKFDIGEALGLIEGFEVSLGAAHEMLREKYHGS